MSTKGSFFSAFFNVASSLAENLFRFKDFDSAYNDTNAINNERKTIIFKLDELLFYTEKE